MEKGNCGGGAGKGTVGVLGFGFGSGALSRARLVARLHGKACAFGRADAGWAKVEGQGCRSRLRAKAAVPVDVPAKQA